MSRFISLMAISLSLSSMGWAQRVLYSSQSINGPYDAPIIKVIRPHWAFKAIITIKYADGHSKQVPKDSIWGYQDRRGRIYRYYKNEFYRVRKTDNLVHYKKQRPTGQGVASLNYFSADYDSPLRWTKVKARRDSSK